MRMSDDTNEVLPRLARAKAKMDNPKKDAVNPFHKNRYATLNACMEVAQPVLEAEGLMLLQPVHFGDGGWQLATTILHPESGQYISWSIPLSLEGKTPQEQGSAITYARRYCLCLIGLVAEDDDDGNQASGIGSSSATNGSSRFGKRTNGGSEASETGKFRAEIERLTGGLRAAAEALSPQRVRQIMEESGSPHSTAVTPSTLEAFKQGCAAVRAALEQEGNAL